MPISLLFNLGICTCALRKYHQSKGPGSDSDRYILVEARWGEGKRTTAVPAADNISLIILNYYGTSIIYLCAVTFSKLAILDIYLHIFIDRLSRYAVYAVGSVIILSLVVNFLTVITQCRPISVLWNPEPGGWCNNIHAHFIWSSLPNMLTDLMMLGLPIPMIWKLHASWRVKAGVFFTFLVGSLYDSLCL